MLHAPVRALGLVITAGVLSASLAWAEEPAGAAKAVPAKETAPKEAAVKDAAAKPADEVAVLETTKGRDSTGSSRTS
jgi:hypothetical protein